MLVLRAALFLAGLIAVFGTVGSAVRTVVLPRAVQARITRVVFRGVRQVFRLRAGPSASFEKRDAIMASYAPASLLILVVVWLVSVFLGYAAMFLALSPGSVSRALMISGSSLLTLGFARPTEPVPILLVFSEAALGLLLLALLITFLPSLYSNFSKRETLVALLEIRAGSPPTAEEMFLRFWRLHGLERLEENWVQWEVWFAELEETHTSFPALVFFRSPQPQHSWVTAAGAVLDAASLRASTIDMPRDITAELCIRAGYVALGRIAAFFGLPFDADPKPTDPISIGQNEFNSLYESLREAGLPVKSDKEAAWKDFSGWRVNYDRVLVGLAMLTMAPYAPWSSDRSIPGMQRPRLFKQIPKSEAESPV